MQDAIHNLKFKCLLLIGLVSIFLLTGCTNWKKKHDNLLVVHKNLLGRYEYLEGQRRDLGQQITQSQQTIQELQRQIAEGQSAATASGFQGDVRFDPSAGTITVTLPNAILFDSGKATLKKRTSTELDHIRSVLRQQRYSNKQIDVVGHTDSDPIKKSKWRDNWQLSAERALAVVGYLTKRGVPPDKIRSVGCGAARPITSNTTASGKARNRRVEIVVYMRGTG
jgi:chemotaxis protein MotB